MMPSGHITRRSALALTGSAGISLAARAQGDSDAYLQSLYKQAHAAGQKEVMVYASSSPDNLPLYNAFSKKFPGISVRAIDIFGPPLEARLQAEFASTGPQADLLATGEPDLLNFKPHGWLQPFVPDTAKGVPAQLIGPDNLWVAYATLPLGVIVNTATLPASDMPKSWKDLVGPPFHAKTAISNPGGINGLSQAFAAALRGGAIDEVWLKQLAANKPLITPGAVAALQMVATGQGNMCPITARTQFLTAKKQGAPLDWLIMSEGYTALPAPFALVAKAPHAEAAKLLMAYAMTPIGQQLLSNSGQPGVMPGAPPLSGMPPDTSTTRFILDWRYLQDNYPGLLQRFKKIFNT